MNVNNRRVNKEDLTFFQWLNIYELMTKKEFKELPEYKQENYSGKRVLVSIINTSKSGF